MCGGRGGGIPRKKQWKMSLLIRQPTKTIIDLEKAIIPLGFQWELNHKMGKTSSLSV